MVHYKIKEYSLKSILGYTGQGVKNSPWMRKGGLGITTQKLLTILFMSPST